MAKCIFATDLHGTIDSFEALFATAVAENVDAIILGGDLLPNPGMSPTGQREFITSYLWPRIDTFKLSERNTTLYTILGNVDMREH